MTATLDVWDAQLARAGAPLLAGRSAWWPRCARTSTRRVRGRGPAVSPATSTANELPQFSVD